MRTCVSCFFHKVFDDSLISGKKDFLVTYFNAATRKAFWKHKYNLKQQIPNFYIKKNHNNYEY